MFVAAAVVASMADAAPIRMGFTATITQVDAGFEGAVGLGDSFSGELSLLDDRVWSSNIFGETRAIEDVVLRGQDWAVALPGLAGTLDTLEGAGQPISLLSHPATIFLSIGTPTYIAPPDAEDNLGEPVFNVVSDADGNIIGFVTDYGDLVTFYTTGLVVPYPFLTLMFRSSASAEEFEALAPNLPALWPQLSGRGAIGWQRDHGLGAYGPLAHFEVTSVYAIPEPASAGLALAAVAGGLLAFGRGRRGRASVASGRGPGRTAKPMTRMILTLATLAIACGSSVAGAGVIRVGFEATFTNIQEGFDGPIEPGDTLVGKMSIIDDQQWDTGFIWGVTWAVTDVMLTGNGWNATAPGLAGAFSKLENVAPGVVNDPIFSVSFGEPVIVPSPSEEVVDNFEPSRSPAPGLVILDGGGNTIGVIVDYPDYGSVDNTPLGLVIPAPVVTLGFQVARPAPSLPELIPNLPAMWPYLTGTGAIGTQSFFNLNGHGPLAHFEVTSVYAIPEPASAGLALAAFAGGLLAFGRGRRGRPSAASGKLKGGLVRSASILSLAACAAALGDQAAAAEVRIGFSGQIVQADDPLAMAFPTGTNVQGSIDVSLDEIVRAEGAILGKATYWFINSASVAAGPIDIQLRSNRELGLVTRLDGMPLAPGSPPTACCTTRRQVMDWEFAFSGASITASTSPATRMPKWIWETALLVVTSNSMKRRTRGSLN